MTSALDLMARLTGCRESAKRLLSMLSAGKPVRPDPHGILTAMVEARRNSPEIVAYRKNRAAQIQRRETAA